MRKGFLTSLLLFGIFFGAGNLIFPPTLGVQSGEHFFTAMLGFVLSGVGIAVLTLVLGTLNTKGYMSEISTKISSKFAVLFLAVLYLSIGPFFAIPRTAAVSFNISVSPFFNMDYSLLIYTIVYFGLAYSLAIHPSKILTSVGKVLTPIFALLILLLVVLGSLKFSGNQTTIAIDSYQNAQAFGTGFLEGYNTLDALAAVAFSVVALNTFKTLGFKSKKEYLFTVSLVAVFVAIGFSVLYFGLGYLGNKFPVPQEILMNKDINLGAYILTESARIIFGDFGSIFLGAMVVVTCFTTTVGLIVATSDYFVTIYNRLSYKTYAIIFTTIGFFIANLGLNTIITFSIPVLLILYPITITLVLLVIINKKYALSKLGMQMTVGMVVFVSVITVLANTLNISFINELVAILPFSEQSMPWLVPAILGVMLSIILPNKQLGQALNFEDFSSTK